MRKNVETGNENPMARDIGLPALKISLMILLSSHFIVRFWRLVCFVLL